MIKGIGKEKDMDRKIVAGVVGFGYEGYSLDCVDKITKRVLKDLEDTGLFVFKEIPKVQNYEQGQRAIQSFSSVGCDLLISIVASWLDARGAIPFLLANKNIPVLLYSTGGKTGKDGVLFTPAAGAGAPGILEPMRAAGIKFEYIYEPPDCPTKKDEILRFARAAKAVNDLKTKRLGSMGFSDMGLYTTNFDNTLIRNLYGIVTEFFDMLEVERRISGLKKSDVEAGVSRLKREWKFLGKEPKRETLVRVIRIFLAIRQIIGEKKLSAISLKCVEGMMEYMNCAPCMIGTLLGDECCYICECDVPGMLGHVILNAVSGKVVTFVESYEFWDDRVLFGACGFLPESMIKGKKVAKLFKTTPCEFLMNCSKMTTGRVTLIRPFFRQGKGLFHMVTGEAVSARKWLEIGFEKPGMHPSIELVLDGTMKHFADNVPAQHFSLVYGNYAKEITYLCKLLDVELIYEAPERVNY